MIKIVRKYQILECNSRAQNPWVSARLPRGPLLPSKDLRKEKCLIQLLPHKVCFIRDFVNNTKGRIAR